jgi:hypothetical protein
MSVSLRDRMANLLGDRRQPQVEEELLHHLRCLVEENEAKGMSSSEAWDAAQGRFGSLQQYSRECRQVAGGSVVPWRMATAAGLLLAAFVAVWHAAEVRRLHQNYASLLERSKLSAHTNGTDESAVPNSTHHSDLVGQIVDPQGRPVANANVLVILKTWPNRRYRQEDFAALTDSEGRFRLAALVPTTGQYGIQLAALGDGFALGSTYQLIEEEDHPAAPPMLLKLEPAKRLMVQVRDANGQPIAGAKVVPRGRRTRDGETHSIYFQASGPVQADVDEQGRAPMNCFESGDVAEIAIQLPGDEWQEREVQIDEGHEIIIVSS